MSPTQISQQILLGPYANFDHVAGLKNKTRFIVLFDNDRDLGSRLRGELWTFKPFRDKMGLIQPRHGQPGPQRLMLKDPKHPVTSLYIDDVSQLHLKVHVKKLTRTPL